ncbi:nitrite/sulfite reductase [Methylogaea oryzae]|uniref:Sulfite reductase n=1 Tax=Methylogaea oryzae TaxID=1295382 RepID=A0A8D4VNZ6_9GAMM|nr:nitrite/sulfite reductase [Methylogaea oryzae]BBL71121.1 sulfite reductase [Methylogaea oryzae]
MYQYDQYDQTLVDERVAQFRDQTRRFLAGELTEDQFRPLRLMNGLYIQRHAPMLRVAIPYGLLSSRQLRKLAHIARAYDKSYAHITTRQNIQYNWPKLEQVPDILAELAQVEMHAIQTSGSCIRSVTSDHLAGISPDEIVDPRPYCEIIRQWSSLHPEFAFLPRKFKIAVSGSQKDRAATQLHDIGVHVLRAADGEVAFEILVGGGLGRTPIIGQVIRPHLEKQHLLSYLEAILRVYNRYGRRDNKYKARIKILVKEEGMDSFRRQVEEEWLRIRDGLVLEQKEIDRVSAFFAPPPYAGDAGADLSALTQKNADFSRWLRHNTVAHKAPGYRGVYVSLKSPDAPPGDITDRQLDAVADLADRYSFGQVRSSHTQNLLLADVQERDLFDLWQRLATLKLASPNVGMATDMICCPGLDFCSLANAASLSVSKDIYDRFDNLDYLYDVGELRINISGCMNGCAHQTVGHIGILGVDKHGEEWYQITLGGSSSNEAALGERLGPSVPKSEVADAVMTIVKTYVEQRQDEETFLQAVQRLGIAPFKEQVYANR